MSSRAARLLHRQERGHVARRERELGHGRNREELSRASMPSFYLGTAPKLLPPIPVDRALAIAQIRARGLAPKRPASVLLCRHWGTLVETAAPAETGSLGPGCILGESKAGPRQQTPGHLLVANCAPRDGPGACKIFAERSGLNGSARRRRAGSRVGRPAAVRSDRLRTAPSRECNSATDRPDASADRRKGTRARAWPRSPNRGARTAGSFRCGSQGDAHVAAEDCSN